MINKNLLLGLGLGYFMTKAERKNPAESAACYQRLKKSLAEQEAWINDEALKYVRMSINLEGKDTLISQAWMEPDEHFGVERLKLIEHLELLGLDPEKNTVWDAQKTLQKIRK